MSDAGGDDAARGPLLIADDDRQIRSVLGRRLRERGYRVLEAADGEEALALALAERPALIILDVVMPRRNGWEVARMLRQHPETAAAKILMLTAIGPVVNETTSPLYGADDILDKPFDLAAFEAKVAELLTAP